MADKLRRQKDVIKKALSSYLNATTSGKYLTYFEGSPTYITYYQLDSMASLEDIGLETVNSLVGKNTPNKYKRIFSVPVWGVDALDVSNELSERGLQATVNGELLFLPNSIRPYPGDFFVFEYEGLEDHLFRIQDVQYDKLTPEKFYRCQYALYQNNTDEIFDNVCEDYECQYDSTNNTITITKSSDIAKQEESQNLVDGLIEKYDSLFYDEESDTFICRNKNSNENGEYYWSPYLQHFLHETKALDPYNSEIMTEIYINDINEIDNGNIYSEEAYRNSLFRSIQIQDKEMNFDMNFLCVSDYNLKCTRNLPFFMSPLQFKLVTPIVRKSPDDPTAYLNAFPIFFTKNFQLFKDVDHYHKIHELDELHIANIEPYIKNGDLIYECRRHELEPTKILMAIETFDKDVDETFLEIHDVSIENLIKEGTDTSKFENFELFNIIKNYLNGTFKLTEDVVNTLNNLYYKPSVENYIMIPLVLYILKDSIS